MHWRSEMHRVGKRGVLLNVEAPCISQCSKDRRWVQEVVKKRWVRKLGIQCNSFESQDLEIIHRTYEKTPVVGWSLVCRPKKQEGLTYPTQPSLLFSSQVLQIWSADLIMSRARPGAGWWRLLMLVTHKNVSMSCSLVSRAGNFPSSNQPPLFPGLPHPYQDLLSTEPFSHKRVVKSQVFFPDWMTLLSQNYMSPLGHPNSLTLAGRVPGIPFLVYSNEYWGLHLLGFLLAPLGGGRCRRLLEVTFQSGFYRTTQMQVCLGLMA